MGADWTHRCPPGPRVVQAAVVAVLQAAGVWHSGGVVDLEPVRVVGHPAAAELEREVWGGVVGYWSPSYEYGQKKSMSGADTP